MEIGVQTQRLPFLQNSPSLIHVENPFLTENIHIVHSEISRVDFRHDRFEMLVNDSLRCLFGATIPKLKEQSVDELVVKTSSAQENHNCDVITN